MTKKAFKLSVEVKEWRKLTVEADTPEEARAKMEAAADLLGVEIWIDEIEEVKTRFEGA